MVAIAQFSNQWKAGNLMVAHVNHAVRGAESEDDGRFVGELAAKLGLEFHQSEAVPSTEFDHSEESLRNLRYDRLIQLAQTTGSRYIVTGHNLDDQVETILFRIFRGTGISGLAGIPPRRLASQSVTIVRPLLEVTRQSIENYLREIDQPFRFDSSNTDSKYARNYLRNGLIPELKARFGESVADSILRLGKQAQEFDCFLLTQSNGLADALTTQSASRVIVDCRKIQLCDPLVIRRWIVQIWVKQEWPRQAMTFQWWQTIGQSLQSEADVVLNLPCSIRLEKTGMEAVFSDLRKD